MNKYVMVYTTHTQGVCVRFVYFSNVCAVSFLEWVSCQSISFVRFSSGKSVKEEDPCALPLRSKMMEIQGTLNDYLLSLKTRQNPHCDFKGKHEETSSSFSVLVKTDN